MRARRPSSESKPVASRAKGAFTIKKKRPHFWGHPKEAREGGKVREGDAYRLEKQSRNGDVEIVRRGLKSLVETASFIVFANSTSRAKGQPCRIVSSDSEKSF